MPKFTHDCDCCTFLGTVHSHGRVHDFYAHEAGSIDPTLIARFGDDGPEYSSMPASTLAIAPEAFKVLGDVYSVWRERNYKPLPNTLERARVLHSELVAIWRNMTEIAEQTDNWDGVAEVEAMLAPEDRER